MKIESLKKIGELIDGVLILELIFVAFLAIFYILFSVFDEELS